MSTKLVKVDEAIHGEFADFSHTSGTPITVLVERAMRMYADMVLPELKASYARAESAQKIRNANKMTA